MRFLALIGALAIIVAIGAAIYFFGGFYNVGQSADNPALVDWALASARGASVVAHGTETPPANLEMPRPSKPARDRTRRSAASIVTEGRRTPIGRSGLKG